MKLTGKIVLWVLTWPVFLGWLWPLLMFVLVAARDLRVADGILQATWRDWVTKPRRFLGMIKWPFGREVIIGEKPHRDLWKYSTTLAAGMVLQKGAGEWTLKHEGVHVRQCRGLVILGLCLGLIVSGVEGNWWWLLGLWAPPGLALYKLPNFLVPILEGAHVYRDAEHERSAYAQTDPLPGGSSWLDEHLKRDRGW